jgi:hypothetical protein
MTKMIAMGVAIPFHLSEVDMVEENQQVPEADVGTCLVNLREDYIKHHKTSDLPRKMMVQ